MSTPPTPAAVVAALDPRGPSSLVVAPEHPEPGFWAGAPAAVAHGSGFLLAYRRRRPVGQGRGVATELVWSPDGVRTEPVVTVTADELGGASLERAALTRSAEGGWRLYLSVATPGSDHWRVDLIEADRPEALSASAARTVLPGSSRTAVKDPVVVRHGARWHLWASCHPLDLPGQTDRMTTEHATSDDGIAWTWTGTALAGRPGTWDERAVRVTAVLLEGAEPFALYDGRADATENFEERTGLARIDASGALTAVGSAPLAGLRYACLAEGTDGSWRVWYERSRPDGAHELRTARVLG